jgi:hypothetical protein
MIFTTSDLIASVQSRAMLPSASVGSLSNATILNFATEEMLSGIVPMILSAREKYYETHLDVACVQNQATYGIPPRAIGSTVSSVQWIYGINILQLNPIDPPGVTSLVTAPSPRAFYFENGNIYLYPPPSSSNYTIRIRYFQRPSHLEQTINCAQITAINTVANTVTVSSIPSSWTTGTVVDFIPQTLPCTPYGLNSAILSVSNNVVSFSSLPSNPSNNAALTVGDWLALAEYTPIPEIPNEFFPVLAQSTVCRCLEAIGDTMGLQAANQTLQAKAQNAIKLITPRDAQGSKKITSNWRNW